MTTSNDVIKGAIASLKNIQATETDVEIQRLLNEVANPKIAENKAEYDKTVAAMKSTLEQTNSNIVADCKQQAMATVQAKYSTLISTLQSLIEE